MQVSYECGHCVNQPRLRGEPERRWRDGLAAWAIPDHILAGVTQSPWTLPTEVFTRRADDQLASPGGVSWQHAREALVPPGTVLDVGAGAGAASLPLAPVTTALTAVDQSETMLAELARRAAGLGLPATLVVGRWPEVDAPVADVVLCHHVLYNVAELSAFVRALNDHARRRVVIELTPMHPLTPLSPLWRIMHGIERPHGPSADDAVAVLRAAGLDPVVHRWARRPRPDYPTFAELIAATRRRLCLPPERDGELAAALRELGVDPAHPRDLAPADDSLVTLWWDRADGDQAPADRPAAGP